MNINDQFMQSFNNIENLLRKMIDARRNLPFYRLVEKNAKESQLVKQFYDELKSMGDLRNFIVHGDIEYPLATASKSTIERIQFIEKQLTNPTRILDLFSRNIKGIDEEDSLESVLEIVKTDGYSQIPVVNKNGFTGLITENGITNWLANNAHKNIISIKDTKVKDVVLGDEYTENYSLMYSKDPLYDVIETFEKGRSLGKPIFIIIVLNSPKKKIFLRDIYTIITPWDLDLIYNSLGL